MSMRSIIFTLFVSLIVNSAYGQLPPDVKSDWPQHPEASKLLEKIVAQRSKLNLTADVAALKSHLVIIDELVSQAKQTRELEIQKSGPEAPTTKRLNLLVEGFERLHDRVERIPKLIETKEHVLAAETMKFVAAMDRAWTGKYNPDEQPLFQAANEQSKLGTALSRPFASLKTQIDGRLAAKKWDEVSKLYSQLIEEQRTQLGPNHSEVVDSLLTASGFEFTQGQLARSIELGKAAQAALAEVYGKTHWEVRRIEARLKSVEKLQKFPPDKLRLVISAELAIEELKTALPWRSSKVRDDLLAHAVTISMHIKDDVGSDSQMYAKATGTIAQLCGKYQNPSESNFRFEIADVAMRAVQLDQTPEYAALLNSWSVACKTLGDDERAFKLIKDAIHLSRGLYGEEHLEYINHMENFGSFFFQGKGFEKALYVFEKVSKLRLALFGPSNELYQHTRVRIATTLFKLERADEAEPILTELASMRKPKTGFETELDINLADMLGTIATKKGNQEEAVRHSERYVELAGRAYGKSDIRYSIALSDLAGTLMRSGNEPRIGTLLTQALKIDRQHVDRISYAQTERQHFRKIEEFRYSLFLFLTYATGVGNLDREAYEHILAWKGRSFRERWASNAARHASKTPQVTESYTQLCRILSNYATVIEQNGEKVPKEAEFMKVVEDKEAMWRLASRTKAKTDEVTKASLEQIQQALPKHVALVDYSYYRHLTYVVGQGPVAEERLVAAVVRADQPVKLIPLGKAKPLDKMILAWRKELQAGQGSVESKASNDAPQNLLRAQLWEPVEDHLKGIETVLICPDGFLDLLPWDALPSRTAGKYLIEDYAIHKLPVAQFVVRPKAATTDPVSMLLLGNPTYQAVINGKEVKPDGMHFGPLPGTAKELGAISALYNGQKTAGNFKALQMLRGTSASEERVRKLATEVRYLHLATHGFFRPDIWNARRPGPLQTQAQQQVTIFIPEVLSGIALTAANNGLTRKANSPANAIPDDGLLTALEVTTLDLRRVDLVVLSACDTSVGKIQANESTLGLQQSFQIAGARATISSLWPVDDAATQTLMVEFYRNLWEEKRSHGDALRQAQLSMLNRYDPTKQVLAARGLKLTKPQQPAEKQEARLHPQYWACFTLSGDWR